MARIACRTGVDFALAERSGVMVDFFGDVMLASRNEFTNGDLSELDEDGNLPEWELLHAASPDFWNVYSKAPGDSSARITRQNPAPISIRDNDYLQRSPLVEGSELPDPTDRAKIANPLKPRVRLDVLGAAGFKAGWRGIALGWIVGHPDSGRSRRFTEPGPRSLIQLGQGQCPECGLYTRPPEGVAGIAIYMTRAADSENEAATLPLFRNAIVDARGGAPITKVVRGPFEKGERAPSAFGNETFVGDEGQWAPPEFHVPKANGELQKMTTEISYAFRTRYGWSMQQGIQTVIVTEKLADRVIRVRPRRLPDTAIEWQLQFTDPSGQWQALPTRPAHPSRERRRRNKYVGWAQLFTNDPEKFEATERASLPTAIINEEDATGITGPEEDVPSLVAVGNVEPAPGKYPIYTTFGIVEEGERERESAPSPREVITIGANQTFYVKRPPLANDAENPEFRKRDPSNGKPRNWNLPDKPGVTHDSADSSPDGRHRIRDKDRTADPGTADQEVAETPEKYHEDRDNTSVAHRLGVEIEDYVSGRVDVILRQINDAGAIVDRVVRELREGAGKHEVEVSVGPSQARPHVTQIPNVSRSRLVIKHVGSKATGRRDFNTILDNLFSGEGKVAARKRIGLPVGIGSAFSVAGASGTEKPEDPYPSGSYCEFVENPESRPVISREDRLTTLGLRDGVMPSDWVRITNGGANAPITEDAAITGDYGIECRTTDTTQLSSAYARYIFNQSEPVMYLRWLSLLAEPPVSGTLDLGGFYDLAGNIIAIVRYTSGGVLRFITRSAGEAGALVNTEFRDSMGTGDELEFEVKLENFGTSNGAANLDFARFGHKTRQVVRTAAVDWSALTLSEARCGAVAQSNAAATFNIRTDNAVVSRNGFGIGDPIPGNMIEYYGTPRTPLSDGYGPRAKRLPVKPAEDVCFSNYFWYRGVERRSTPFKIAVKNRRGETIETRTYNNMAGVKGRSWGWDRDYRGFTTPPGAAYVEYVGGALGEGLWRCMGFQYDRGRLTPSEFTNEHAPDGEITATLSTRVPGLPDFTVIDHHGETKELLGGGAAATLGDDFDTTSVSWEFRSRARVSAMNPNPQYGAWVPSIDQLIGASLDVIQVRAHLHTDDITVSPTVHEMFVEVLRHQPVLLRRDGTEFDGGAVVVNLSPTNAPEPTQVREFADYTQGYRVMGPEQRSVEFAVQTYLNSAATEISKTREFDIEDLGKRFSVECFDLSFGQPDRNLRPVDSPPEIGEDGIWILDSETVTARVIREKILEAELVP